MNVTQAVETFIDHQLTVRGIAPTTAKLYASHLGAFSRAVGPSRDLRRASVKVEGFLASLGRRKLSDHTRAKAFCLVRDLYRHHCERGRVGVNPLRDQRPPIVRQRPRVFLKKGEVLKLLEAVRGSGRQHAARDHAIIACLYYGLLRISEALRLRPEDVDFDDESVLVCGKGGTVIKLPLHNELADILRRWINVRPSSPWLFPSQAHGHEETGQLTNDRVEFSLRKVYAPSAGLLGRVTPHTLRRSAADELRRRGVKLEDIQGLLRHANLSTTMIYLQESPEELKRALEKL